jgi:hypothetical protein
MPAEERPRSNSARTGITRYPLLQVPHEAAGIGSGFEPNQQVKVLGH